MADPIINGAIPGANVGGVQTNFPQPVSGMRSVGGANNPLIPGFPSGQAVPSSGPATPSSFSAYTSPFGASAPNMSSTLPGTNVQSGLQSAGYPGSVADALNQFLQGGAGYNPQVAQALLASLQPGIEQGSQQIIEQYGAAGLGNSSAASIGLGNYLSQASLNEGQILSGLYENSVQNYMNILTGAKNKGPGVLGDISSLLAGLGGGTGMSNIATTLGKALGLAGGSAASAAPSVLGTALPGVGQAGSLAAAGLGGAGTAAGALPAIGEAGSLAAAGLGTAGALGGAAGAAGGLAALPLSSLGSAGLAGALTPDAIAGLGAGGGAAAGGGGLLSAIGGLATNPFTIGIAALLGGGLLAKDLFFKGANPNQVPAAKAEQPYEAAGDNVMKLIQAGQITPQQGIGYLKQLQSQGQAAEQKLVPQIGDVATKGSENLTKVINDLITKAGGITQTSTSPLNLSSVQSQFIQPNAPGWYSGTGSQAMQLLSQLGIQ